MTAGGPVIAPAVAYWHDPADVVWIYVGPRRLQGMDNYWVDGNRYGMWNDPDNRDMYEGAMAVAFEYDPATGTEHVIDPTPPAGAATWRGVMLDDDAARFVGLI